MKTLIAALVILATVTSAYAGNSVYGQVCTTTCTPTFGGGQQCTTTCH